MTDHKTKFEQAMDEYAINWATSILHDTKYMTPDLVEARYLGVIEGCNKGAAYERQRAEKLVALIKDYIEVENQLGENESYSAMEFREALAAYESGGINE